MPSSSLLCVCIAGFAAIYLYGRVDYPGAVLNWPLFWCCALWGLGQGSIGVSLVFGIVSGRIARRPVVKVTDAPVERRRVPVIAAQLHDLFNAMMLGVVGAGLSLLFALLLPGTAGRKFAVIESKEHS